MTKNSSQRKKYEAQTVVRKCSSISYIFIRISLMWPLTHSHTAYPFAAGKNKRNNTFKTVNNNVTHTHTQRGRHTRASERAGKEQNLRRRNIALVPTEIIVRIVTTHQKRNNTCALNAFIFLLGLLSSIPHRLHINIIYFIRCMCFGCLFCFFGTVRIA